MIKVVKVKSAANLFDLTGKFGSDAPLKRIFQIVLSQKCRTILVESDHHDTEYTSEFEAFYKGLFKRYSPTTRRLHFFSCDISDRDIPTVDKFGKEYLGFCVLRPFTAQVVAYAVIKPLEDLNYPKRFFVLCQKDFPVKIQVNSNNTRKLVARGFPFIQQDGQLGCCSHVSLSAIDNYLSAKPHTVDKIVQMAALVPGIRRDVPTAGLDAIQICQTLKGMGYAPLIYEYGEKIKSPFPPERVIYHYMESEIPIILGIPTESSGHALTIIGHSFEPDMWWALAQTSYYRRRPSGGPYHCSTTWIQNFIVNDDNFGPYLTIPKEFIWAKAQERLLIVVPLPENVYLQGEDAEIYAHRMLSEELVLDWMRRSAKGSVRKLSQTLLQHLRNEDVVLRTCLIPSARFKEKYSAPHLHDFYKRLPMPDRIWLTEISIPELFCQSRLRLGEIIMDSTASPLGHSFLAIHLPGIMITRDPNREHWNYYPIKNDEPFGHLMR